MGIYKLKSIIKKIIKEKFWLILALVVLISYGQILGMGVWKDDNAIFFKFTHINEPAGFFGTGLLGQGPYRFSVTPYWFVYKLVGYSHVWVYYLLILLFYFLVTLTVYKIFSRIVSPAAGRVAGLLVAAGFVGSDGYMWLGNAMLTDVSLILDLLVLLFYWLYLKQKRVVYYLLAVGVYWLVSFFAPLRGHYFVAVIFLFELLYSGVKKLYRFIPFGLIFYIVYYLINDDPRSSLVSDYFSSILSGKLYLTQGFFSSMASLVIPDWFSSWLYAHFPSLILPGMFLVVVMISYLFFEDQKWRLGKTAVVAFLGLVWIVIARNIFVTPVLALSPDRQFIAKLGGLVS